jgi:tripartite-type tricarboxylate transporter receptor subunit TctC
MKHSRRVFLRIAAAAAAIAAVPFAVQADTYPSHPARIIVAFPAGGPQDITARLIAQWLSDHLGQQFLVESKPGAGSTLGAEYVVNSPPDGYTLLLCGPPNTIGVTLYDKLKWNFVHDMAPVAAISKVPLVAEVNPGLPVKSIPELIAYAKANPNKINYGSAGVGTPQHVAGELFKMMTGVAMQHVPYRGSAPALTDLLGGQIQLMIETTPASLDHIRTGRFRGLAVTTLSRAEPRRGAARAPDGFRFRAGLRGDLLVRYRRGQEHAPRNRGQAQHGDQRRSRRSEIEGAAGRIGRHRAAGLCRRLRQVHRQRDRGVGQGGQGRQHEGAVTPAPATSGTRFALRFAASSR